VRPLRKTCRNLGFAKTLGAQARKGTPFGIRRGKIEAASKLCGSRIFRPIAEQLVEGCFRASVAGFPRLLLIFLTALLLPFGLVFAGPGFLVREGTEILDENS
jgi:hypothetical protein